MAVSSNGQESALSNVNRSSILRTLTTFNTREVSMGLTSGIVFAVTLIRNLAYAVFKWWN